MARGDSNNFSSVSYSFASFLFVANETLTPPALHPVEARSQHATSLVCTTLQRGLLSSRLLRALDSIGSPGCLHPFTLVVLTSNRIERVHLFVFWFRSGICRHTGIYTHQQASTRTKSSFRHMQAYRHLHAPSPDSVDCVPKIKYA